LHITSFVALAAPHDALAGKRLADRYLLTQHIGSGVSGVVYSATQLALDRQVAVKILRHDWASDPEQLERFHQEALVAGHLNHPNIVSIFDYGQADGMVYIVMEYVRGGTLGHLVRHASPLPVDRAVDLVSRILNGLGAAHQAGVVHADVKADNVMIERHRDVEIPKLVDFGFARMIRNVCTGECCSSISGTPAYMAPEVISGQPHSEAADIYSTGVLLYELLTGTTPFGSRPIADVLHHHVNSEVIPPSVRRPDGSITRALDEVVLRALAKNPSQRHLTVTALQRSLAEASVSGHPRPIRAGSVFQRRVANRRRHIGEAIRSGDTNLIAARYLALADAFGNAGDYESVVRELAEAIDVISLGEGAQTSRHSPAMWRILVALSWACWRTDRASMAVTSAAQAMRHAALCGSERGEEQARVMISMGQHRPARMRMTA
jgi:serine/threonine protein kinase